MIAAKVSHFSSLVGTANSGVRSHAVEGFKALLNEQAASAIEDINHSSSNDNDLRFLHGRIVEMNQHLAEYSHVRFIPQGSRALHLELFTVPSTFIIFYEVIDSEGSQ
jgi:hypothetical protein